MKNVCMIAVVGSDETKIVEFVSELESAVVVDKIQITVGDSKVDGYVFDCPTEFIDILDVDYVYKNFNAEDVILATTDMSNFVDVFSYSSEHNEYYSGDDFDAALERYFIRSAIVSSEQEEDWDEVEVQEQEEDWDYVEE